MLNELVGAVARAVKEAFPEAAVYDEEVEQGIVAPAFSVRLVRARQELFRGRRYLKRNTVNVVYFPPGEGRQQDCQVVQERLFQALEVVRAADGLLRGANFEAHGQDGVLVVVVDYDFFVDRVEMEEVMGEVAARVAPVR